MFQGVLNKSIQKSPVLVPSGSLMGPDWMQ